MKIAEIQQRSQNLRSKLKPEVVLAAIWDLEGAKSRENAVRKLWSAMIAGVGETALLVFHFQSRMSDRK